MSGFQFIDPGQFSTRANICFRHQCFFACIGFNYLRRVVRSWLDAHRSHLSRFFGPWLSIVTSLPADAEEWCCLIV
jgi:hypothetical protein